MSTIYFGPVTASPSWAWVGRDIADAMQNIHTVKFFSAACELPKHCVVIWIKAPPDAAGVAELKFRKVRIVFFPVDYFQNLEHIAVHQDFLDCCRVIALHSRSLAPFFDAHKVHLVDHYNKYGLLPSMRAPGKALLWIGGFQYAPYVLKYLLDTGLGAARDIVLLTDHQNPRAWESARLLAGRLGLGLPDLRSFNGLATVHPWSEPAQSWWLRHCAAAFDIKEAADFNQFHKPPTKLQKYLCSKIPVAINQGLPLAREFSLNLPEPIALDHWLSENYQKEIDAMSAPLRQRLSRGAIAGAYNNLIDAAAAS